MSPLARSGEEKWVCVCSWHGGRSRAKYAALLRTYIQNLEERHETLQRPRIIDFLFLEFVY